jgi:uncharacterized DUF497 family protein
MFEYDESKSRSNYEKHGIDFVEAQRLWDDPDRIIEAIAAYIGELRYFVTGKLNGKFYTAVITYRNSNIRIISVRRSRKREVYGYEKNISGRI